MRFRALPEPVVRAFPFVRLTFIGASMMLLLSKPFTHVVLALKSDVYYLLEVKMLRFRGELFFGPAFDEAEGEVVARLDSLLSRATGSSKFLSVLKMLDSDLSCVLTPSLSRIAMLNQMFVLLYFACNCAPALKLGLGRPLSVLGAQAVLTICTLLQYAALSRIGRRIATAGALDVAERVLRDEPVAIAVRGSYYALLALGLLYLAAELAYYNSELEQPRLRVDKCEVAAEKTEQRERLHVSAPASSEKICAWGVRRVNAQSVV